MATAKLRKVALDDIRPYWRNPRKNAVSVPVVKQSMLENGYINLITVDKDNVIVTGHTRFKALREMTETELKQIGAEKTIQVVDLSHLSDEQVKRYRIQDNKAGEKSTWDYDLLIPELRELSELGTMQLFFPDLNLDTLVAPPTVSTVDMTPASDQEVEDAETGIEERYHNSDEEQSAKVREVICPHCLKEFFVENKAFRD